MHYTKPAITSVLIGTSAIQQVHSPDAETTPSIINDNATPSFPRTLGAYEAAE
jgi:hypothetical protein